jgi:cytochrome bd-type quinol oxidase subunit 2
MVEGGAAPFRPVPPYQEWPDRVRRRVASGVLFGVTVWRLLIVVFAIIGFSLAMRDATGSDALAALSQQASLLVAICYGFLLLFPVFTGGRRHEPDTPWLRGALTVLLSLVSVTFLTMLGGDLSQKWSLFEHLLTPALVVLDWLVVGRDQRNARWWYPVSWLAFPLAYLLFYIAYVGNGPPIYPFLDPAASDFLGVVFEFLGGVLVFGFVVYGLGKLHGRGRQ